MSTTIADTLFEAQTAGRAVPMFADLADVAAAYAVQGELLDRYRAAGQRLVGPASPRQPAVVAGGVGAVVGMGPRGS